VPYNKPPYTKYPHLADLLDRDPVAAPWFCRITRNISVGGQMLSVARGIRKEWAIIENNWEGDDPGFVNLAAGDFRLKPDSPALKLGFEPIPFEKIGLIHDDTRASWPVVAEPPPKDWKPRWKAQREQGGRKLGELPVFVATRVPGRIVIDGVVDPKEWATGGAASVAGETYTTAAIEWEVHGRKATYPSQAWLECDAQHLYVAFVNEVDPARGVTGGQQWSKDDAVEIALAVAEKTVGPILILRGWPNGHFESSDEAGAPAALVQRAAQAVQYAAKVTSPGRWSAEWKIPFASLGLDPRAKDRKYLFNLSVRKTSPPEWVLLKKSRSYTWEVRDGAYLQLAP